VLSWQWVRTHYRPPLFLNQLILEKLKCSKRRVDQSQQPPEQALTMTKDLRITEFDFGNLQA